MPNAPAFDSFPGQLENYFRRYFGVTINCDDSSAVYNFNVDYIGTEMNNRLEKEYEQSIIDWKNYLASKIDDDFLDDDGYPTDNALELIAKWHFSDAKGWFEFIENIWHLKSWEWTEGNFKKNESDSADKYRYYISTAGWSGNESIIRAMQSNEMMWHLNWVQSRRGGHYIFELREFDEYKERVSDAA